MGCTSQFKKDLIAAKALIDTPEKWCNFQCGCGCEHEDFQCEREGVYDAFEACRAQRPSFHYFALDKALEEQIPLDFKKRWLEGENERRWLVVYNNHPNTAHADIMALFDRAIAQTGA